MRGSSDQQVLLEFDLRHSEIIFDRSKSGNKSAKVSRCQLESCSNHQLFVFWLPMRTQKHQEDTMGFMRVGTGVISILNSKKYSQI